MRFPNLNDIHLTNTLRSQSGQSVVEYILVLVVTVGLILGGVYQLNMAFKVWANNYFGDYLACLLESGELPTVGGTAGDDPGSCNQFFKPFSLADGRPLLPPTGKTASDTGSTNRAPGAGARDSSRAGSGGGGHTTGGSFGNTPYNGSNGGKFGTKNGSGESANTGSTKAVSYGGYSETNRRLDTRTKESLDQKFAFENDKSDNLHGKSSSTSRAPSDSASNAPKIRIRQHLIQKDTGDTDGEPMTFGNFMKYLIIAAIVIALVFFIGGQMLQIGKSME